MKRARIAPSILSADFARLGEEVEAVLKAGADVIHFDVMDHHYVPNLTVGPLVCKALRDHGIQAPIDVHLMVSPVDAVAKAFAEAGASIVSFHPEASGHVDRTIGLIRENGCRAGLAFNPATPLDWLNHTLHAIDLVLIMSVKSGLRRATIHPGQPGQARRSEEAHRRQRAGRVAGSGWRRQGRQHRRDRGRRSRHVRGRFRHLRRRGLCAGDRGDAPRPGRVARSSPRQRPKTGSSVCPGVP